jgi:hypothetical protein
MAGSAGEPPYITKPVRTRLLAPDGYLLTPGGTVTAPQDTTGVPLGIATTPSGSTAFAGATDAMMLRLRQ